MDPAIQSCARANAGPLEPEQRLIDLLSACREEMNGLKAQIDDMEKAARRQQQLFEENAQLLRMQIYQLQARNRQLENRITHLADDSKTAH